MTISHKDVKQALFAVFDGALAEHGFERFDDKKWIDSSAAPIRRMIQINFLKGATVYPCPCFSLDFVPHESGARLRWHRTPKSAMLDVSLDPMDFGPNPSKYHMRYLFGPPGELKLRRVAKDVIRDFVPLLNRVTTIADMVPVVERLKAYHARRFGFYNYVQHPIAAAFIYAKLGQEDLAREELAKWSPLDNLLIADRKRLDRLFEDALQEGRT